MFEPLQADPCAKPRADKKASPHYVKLHQTEPSVHYRRRSYDHQKHWKVNRQQSTTIYKPTPIFRVCVCTTVNQHKPIETTIHFLSCSRACIVTPFALASRSNRAAEPQDSISHSKATTSRPVELMGKKAMMRTVAVMTIG